MIYIACPYWDKDENIRLFRRKKAIEYTDDLFRHGVLCYSPLVYTERYKDSPAKEKYWIRHGIEMVRACNEIRVLCLPGWENSTGIKGEIKTGEMIGLEIKYISEHCRLSFHGSRSLINKATKDLIKSEIEKHNPKVVITHGEPKGVCELTRAVTRDLGLSLKLYHLNNAMYAQGMYHHRSVAVLNDSDYAVFIHDGKSAGTQNEYKLAVKMGIPSTIYLFKNGEYVIEEQVEDKRADELDIFDFPDIDFDIGNMLEQSS